MGDEATVMRELIEFLSPDTRLDVRRAALEYVVGMSGALDGSAGRIFNENDTAMGKALCRLCEATVSDRSPTLAALTNFCSGSPEAAGYLLAHSRVPEIAYDACRLGAPFATLAARLLANLSRHFPDKTQDKLGSHDAKFLNVILELLSSSQDENLALLGYVVVNLSTLPRVRKVLVEEKEFVGKMSQLLATGNERQREIAADVARNLAFEEALHPHLLKESDEYLVSLLTPLADKNDELDDDDIQKLPLRLQYFEGEREKSAVIRQKLIEALYQLCSTRFGRETLRQRGVYALLRELDRATTEPEDPNAPPPKMRPPQLLAQEEHTLHALIGVLIRYEEDMGISHDVASLKDLE